MGLADQILNEVCGTTLNTLSILLSSYFWKYSSYSLFDYGNIFVVAFTTSEVSDGPLVLT
jgi:hypothetical protein